MVIISGRWLFRAEDDAQVFRVRVLDNGKVRVVDAAGAFSHQINEALRSGGV